MLEIERPGVGLESKFNRSPLEHKQEETFDIQVDKKLLLLLLAVLHGQ